MKSLPRLRVTACNTAPTQGTKKPTEPRHALGHFRPSAPPARACEPAAPKAEKALTNGILGGPLGNTAKFAAVLSSDTPTNALQSQTGQGFEAQCQTHCHTHKIGRVDLETGEIFEGDIPAVQPSELAFDPMANTVQRYALQSVVRVLMSSSRTAKCLRWRQPHRQVEVWRSLEYRTASYAGLQTCGSVWACPVCAAKIAERRKTEIVSAMTTHKAMGGSVFLLTLTAPHQQVDGIVDLLEKHSTALRSFWSRRPVKVILSEMGIIGQIRAAEVTHGRRSPYNNGWHPHHHILCFAGLGVDPDAFSPVNIKDWSVRLYLQWAACCESAGLGRPSFLHGLKLDDGTKAAAYVAKWGLEDEMTKGHVRKASKGETPFDFLRAVLADSTDKQAARLFVEFAEAFKGKSQLRWSPGLKKRFAIGELSDEELAAKQDDLARMLGMLTVTQWRDVLRVEGRALVLKLAAGPGGWQDVERFLSSIAGDRGDES